MMTTPASTLPMLPHSSPGPVDLIIVPDLPLDITVGEYSSWQESRATSEILKEDMVRKRVMLR